MQLRSCRLTIRFSYPYILDLRDMINKLQNNGYLIQARISPTPPGSIMVGNFAATKGNIILEFNNTSGIMSFSVTSFDEIPKVVSDLKEILKDLNLGDIDLIELSSEILIRGNLNLNCKILDKELKGFEIADENSSIRLLRYPALKDAYILIIAYKIKKIEEIEKFLSETNTIIESIMKNVFQIPTREIT